MGTQCSCEGKIKLIFACSGAADVGELSDNTARVLHKEGLGKMYCLSAIGAQLNNFIEITKSSAGILAIDGCPVDCARKNLENAGITNYEHLRITDLGFQKGSTSVNTQAIETVAEKGRSILKEVCNVL